MTAGTAAALLFPLVLTLAPAPSPVPAPAEPVRAEAETAPITWEIDTSHSDISFRIRHLVSRVRGSFNDWKGTIVADPRSLEGGSVQVEIKTASIDTNSERRDAHLKSADFFDAAKYPVITFRSTRVRNRGGNITVNGDLTMHGITRPVVLTGQASAVAGVPGKRRIGFDATTTINRKDFDVTWNRAAEGGGAVLGDEVEITINVEAVEKAAS
jgi:polyisoprenoid-binding protein YceI